MGAATFVLGLLLAVSLIVTRHVQGNLNIKTAQSVKLCFEQRKAKCQTECAAQLPQNDSATIRCFFDQTQGRKAAFSQCLADFGITESTPCFALNFTRGQHRPWHHRVVPEPVESEGNATSSSSEQLLHSNQTNSAEIRTESDSSHQGRNSSEASSSMEHKETHGSMTFSMWKRHRTGEADKNNSPKFNLLKQIGVYEQCVFGCFEKQRDGGKSCDDGCPEATSEVVSIFEKCRESLKQVRRGRLPRGAGFRKCINLSAEPFKRNINIA